MKTTRLLIFQSLAIIGLVGLLHVGPVHGQELEDAIENELDKIDNGKTPSASSDTPTTQSEAPTDEDPFKEFDQGVPKGRAEVKPETKSSAKSEPQASTKAAAKPAPALQPRAEPDIAQPEPKTEPVIAQPAPQPPPQSEPPLQGSDEPNYRFEKRVFNIFHGARPVAQDKWAEMIGSRREDVYNVQPGDTLWDISQTLFGDGFFWSKLWAENRDLENPHKIGKGHNIRFVAGNEDVAPTVGVTTATDAGPAMAPIRINSLREAKGAAPVYREQALKDLTPEELSSRTAVEVEELVPRPEMPPAKAARPVMRDLPSSFEEPTRESEDKRYDITGLDAGKVRSLTVPALIIANSYILDSPPKGVGTIVEIESSEKVASVGQNLFIRLTRPSHNGEKFSVILPKGNIHDPVDGSVGPVVEVGGVIEVIGTINEAKLVYRATVIGSVTPIQINSIVSEDPLPRASFARRGTLLNTVVRIIGGEYDIVRKIIGESSVVYLDGGSDAGLTVGDILPVQARRGQRREDTKYPDWSRPIGVLKVIKVAKTVATAVVIQAQEEIHPGDKTGGALPEGMRQIRNEPNEAPQE